MTLLAIDPGRAVKASIGWAVFRSNGSEYGRGEMTWEGLCARLRVDLFHPPTHRGLLFIRNRPMEIHEVVIENFINNPKSRGGQTNGTSEVIGAVEILATQAGVPFTRQPNTILPVAKLHAGYVDRLTHLPHQDAAFLHGHHYLIEKGVLKPVGLKATIHTNNTLEAS